MLAANQGSDTLLVDFDWVREDNVDGLKNINNAIFPIKYDDRVYRDVLACGELSLLAYLSSSTRRDSLNVEDSRDKEKEQKEGATSTSHRGGRSVLDGTNLWNGTTDRYDMLEQRRQCALPPIGGIACRLEQSPSGPKLYIISLGVLAPYRRMGVGSKLLDKCLRFVSTVLPEVTEAALHVHTGNVEAINFYRKFGFVEEEVIRGYYKRLVPPDASLLRKQLKETS